jgi:4-hydroxybenzoate polyprenyltransferase
LKVPVETVRDLIDFLMFSSVYVALISVGMVYLSSCIQGIPLNAFSFVIPFLEVFAIYNFNNRTDEEEDIINRKGRYLFMKQHGRLLSALAISALILALVLSMLHGIMALAITCMPLVLGFLYSASVLPARIGYRRLKEVPLVKNLIVGFSWGLLPGMLPVLIAGANPDSRTFIIFLLFSMWGFVASIIPDIRDRAGDALSGIRTIPVIFGDKKAREFLLCANLIAGVVIIRSSLPAFPLAWSGFLMVSILYSETCIYLMERESMKNFVADVLSDGQFIILACIIGILMAFHISI